MGYLVVPTVNNGDSWSAAQHNTYIRDNFAAVWPFTTAGDISYATSATALSRLALGATGSLLRAGASAPNWLAVGAQGSIMRSNGTSPQWFVIGAEGKTLVARSSDVAWEDNVPGIFAAAGDLVYASAADTSAKLAIGTAGQVLKVNPGATAPVWGSASVVHQIGLATNYASQTVSSPTYADITSMSVTLTTTVTCTLFVYASILAQTTNASYNVGLRALIDTTATGDWRSYSQTDMDNVACMGYKSSAAAGSKVIKMQIASPNSINVTTFGGYMIAVAVPE